MTRHIYLHRHEPFWTGVIAQRVGHLPCMWSPEFCPQYFISSTKSNFWVRTRTNSWALRKKEKWKENGALRDQRYKLVVLTRLEDVLGLSLCSHRNSSIELSCNLEFLPEKWPFSCLAHSQFWKEWHMFFCDGNQRIVLEGKKEQVVQEIWFTSWQYWFSSAPCTPPPHRTYLLDGGWA